MSEQELRDKVAQTFWETSYEQTPQSEQGRVDKVVALITQYSNEARLDELRSLNTDGGNNLVSFASGKATLIPERIAELEQESKS